LLLQSVGDIIRVFPAWPKAHDAKFENLRAQGGFLVSAEQRGGKTVKLQIVSTVGGKLRLLDPWTGQIVEREMPPGQKIEMNPS
jgi:alpha-L-fucosidase 2